MSYSRSHLLQSTSHSNFEYQPALDGIRAIAIAAVLLFHGGFESMSGGFLGVDVFFVLSGYLITTLLLNEYAENGKLKISGFYFRRLRRLLPALAVMLVITLTCASLFMQDVAPSTARDFPSSLTGLSNWWFILHKQCYFEAMGRPALFQHTWSLAVEFQFYWVWPVLLVLTLSVFGELGVFFLALACAAGSITALFLANSPSHAYFGTDTHSLGLFAGAALASQTRTPNRNVGPFAPALGATSLAALAILFHLIGDTADLNYRYSLIATAIATTCLIASANGFTARILSAKPLVWIGQRSYSIYVWHWPVFQATRPGIDISLTGWGAFLFRLAVTLVIAEASYRFVETPIRRGALGRLWHASRSWGYKRFVSTVFATALCVCAAAAWEVSITYKAITNAEMSIRNFGVIPKTVVPPVAKEIATPGPDPLLNAPVAVIGDSVLLGVSPYLKKSLNIVNVDAVVGRQAKELDALVQSMAQPGPLPSIVILDLGNNGTVEESTLRDILESLKTCKKVVVVNAHVPRKWQDDNDALLARIVPTYQNAVLADWRAASEGHREYFGPDGIHAGPHGAKVYADLVVSALQVRKPLPTP